jgi:hypothetical protein
MTRHTSLMESLIQESLRDFMMMNRFDVFDDERIGSISHPHASVVIHQSRVDDSLQNHSTGSVTCFG